MRKLKEGDYFAPKNKEEYGFILKSLQDLGYRVELSDDLEVYKNYPFIVLTEPLGFVASNNNFYKYNEKLSIHDLFIEEEEEEEEETFEVGQRVLVRNNSTSIWQFQIYDRLLHRDDFRHSCVGGAFYFCIDYDTNKEKHGKV